MVARSLVAVCVTAVLAVTGCGAAADDGDTDESASALQWRQADDVPAPGPIDRPAYDELDRRFSLPIWDLKRYLHDERRPGIDLGSCYQYEVQVYDPGKGRKVPIPITVCN